MEKWKLGGLGGVGEDGLVEAGDKGREMSNLGQKRQEVFVYCTTN